VTALEAPQRFHEHRVRVRYAETDQMGVVYHANYLVWMEVGRVEYCRANGLRYRDMEDEEAMHLAVVEVGCRYLAPALYDEELVVKTWVREIHARMVVFGYEIRNAETDRALFTGFTKHVFLGRDLKPKKLPQRYWPVFGLG
jgi:acyl-CoA thioester hydrolase